MWAVLCSQNGYCRLKNDGSGQGMYQEMFKTYSSQNPKKNTNKTISVR